MLRHPEIALQDPIVTTHVLPDAVGWVRREDIGPRTWELPNGLLFQFSPGMPQELVMWGRFVTTIEHEPWEGLAILKSEGEALPQSLDGRDQINGDWPQGRSCTLLCPERGHCPTCDEWFLKGGPQRIDEVPA